MLHHHIVPQPHMRDNIGMTHPLQSAAWGEFRKAMGIDVVVINGWQLTFHRIPFTPWTIGYFPKGPIPDKHMITQLTKLGKEKKAIFIQIEPDATGDFSLLPKAHHPLFTKSTFILDLSKSESALLAAMHPKTRYNIRLAQKHGVNVKEDASAFEQYLSLTRQTTKRQKFYAHNEMYHRTMWEIMHKANIAHLFTASYQDKILSAWIVFVWGDRLYYPYGASSQEHRDVMAPTLMLWEITRWAKQKGLKKFDLWGADPAHGFHRFKAGFNPTLVEFMGSFDLVLNKPLYFLYTIADRIRWKL